MTVATLRFNPAVQVWPFDGAAAESMVICEVPRADGSAARYVLPERVVSLLHAFDGRPTADVIRACATAEPPPPRDFDRIVGEMLVPRGILVPEGSPGHAPPRRADALSYMTVKVPLLQPWLVTPLARGLAWLFYPPLLVALCVLIVVAHVLFYGHLAPEAGLTLAAVRGSDVAALVAFMVFSTVLHELGHAAAAARFGCRRLIIGWGLYYHISVLYTDLSEAWRLSRGQRALVDLGGIYFQSILMLGLLAAHYSTGSIVPLYCFIATNLHIAGSLNPFFRMDGYWLMSDLLGVSNLHGHSAALLRRGTYRLFGRQDPSAKPSPLSGWALVLLGVYAVLGTAFFLFVLVFVLRVMLFNFAGSYPGVVAAAWTALGARPFSAGAAGAAVFSVAWRGLVLYGMSRLAWKIVERLLGGAGMVFRLLREVLTGPPARSLSASPSAAPDPSPPGSP